MSPEKNWQIGQAVKQLREEGFLILSGGYTVHTFADFAAFAEKTAKPIYKEWDNAILQAVQKPDVSTYLLLRLLSLSLFLYLSFVG